MKVAGLGEHVDREAQTLESQPRTLDVGSVKEEPREVGTGMGSRTP